MKNKRNLAISAIAVLGVILSVTAFLALPRPAESAQFVPAVGHISNGVAPFNQIARQNQAVNAAREAMIAKSPSDEYMHAPQVQAVNAAREAMIAKSPSDEYMHAPQVQAVNAAREAMITKTPSDEYIQAPQVQAENAVRGNKMKFPGDEYIPVGQ